MTPKKLRLDQILLNRNLAESKSKVQASIQGDSVRITGKKRDDLQQIIQLVKDQNYPVPLQYVNFRD